jgi:hypothetical protein
LVILAVVNKLAERNVAFRRLRDKFDDRASEVAILSSGLGEGFSVPVSPNPQRCENHQAECHDKHNRFELICKLCLQKFIFKVAIWLLGHKFLVSQQFWLPRIWERSIPSYSKFSRLQNSSFHWLFKRSQSTGAPSATKAHNNLSSHAVWT